MELNLNNSLNVIPKEKNILTRILDNLIPRDIIPWYTFVALLLKNLLLVGFLVDLTHQTPIFKSSINIAFISYNFRAFYYIAFTFAITSIIFSFKGRSRFIIAIVTNFLISFLLLVDLWYLRGFNTLPTLHTLKAGSNMGDSMSSFFALINVRDLLFVIDIPVLILIAVLKKRWTDNRNVILTAVSLVLCAVSLLFIAPLVNKYSTKPLKAGAVFNKFDAVSTVKNLSPLGYNIYSSYNYFIEDQNIKLEKADKDKITEWYKQKMESLPDNQYKGMFKGKNLLVIQVESLEKFVLRQQIDGQEITPNLNKLLKNSLYFTNYYEQVGNGNSCDADLMTNASVYPIQLGTTFISYPFTTFNSFPKIMKENGYYTSAIHPDSGSFWNWLPALTSMGFEKCYDSKSYDTSEIINMGISDGTFLNQIEPIITKQKQPFYTFIVTLSSHTPFILQDRYKELKLKEELKDSKLGGYLQCIHYTDKQLGLFLEKLKEDGLLDNTVVAIYGDHEGVHRYFPEEIKELKTKQAWWMNNNKHLPLIIYNPNLQPQEIQTAGGQVDIMPTLLYLMGVDEKIYIETAMGRNLLKTNRNFAVLRDRTVVGNIDAKQKEHALQGLEMADLIIRGNYFKK